jgi:CrcB protein
MTTPAHLAIVAIAGGAGCALRVSVRDALMRRGAHPWWSTCAVNLVGACVMGGVAGWGALRAGAYAGDVAAIAVGVLGGWTTYSAFAMDVVQLWLRGSRGNAVLLWALTMLGTPIAALGAAAAVRVLAGGGS